MEVDSQEICEQAISYTNKVKGNIDVLVKPFKEGKTIGQNLPELNNLLEGLGWLNDVLISFNTLYQLDYASVKVGTITGLGIINEYKEFVEQLSGAMDEDRIVEFRKLLSGNLPLQMTALKKLYMNLQSRFYEDGN